MVTFVELRAVRPNRFLDAGGVIRRLASSVATRADEMTAAIALLASGWTGTAATTALNHLTMLRDELYDAVPGLIEMDQALTEFAVELTGARRALIAAAEPRPGSLVQVGPDGVVSFRPIATPSVRDYDEFDEVTAAIADAVARADRADAELHGRLLRVRLMVDRDQALPSVPADGTDPRLVATWWRSLSTSARLGLIEMRPAVIAGLDGVPSDARDQASRLLLHRQLAGLETVPGPPSAGLAALATLEHRLDDPYSTRAYLLDLDAGDNRAIVSIGDPDRATDTLTFVPGVGAGLSSISSTLGAIENIQEAAAHAVPIGDLATIGWVDYAAPPTVSRAAEVGPATLAAGRLSAFAAGLRADGRPGAHEAVLGYSYGSVVTGVAATRHGLDTDDIILVASPGTTTGHADDLGVGPGHVWATVAQHDPIRLVRSWFGPQPTDPTYGARVFTSAPGSTLDAHIDYFDPDSPSLGNVVKIAVGDFADVY
ncbi:MAG TPA: alpha/beta hydrolase [Micromonosporaceae bacterium]